MNQPTDNEGGTLSYERDATPDTNVTHKRKHVSTPTGPVWRKPRNLSIGVGICAVVLALGVHQLIVGAGYEATDDAYLTADVVQVAPQVSGTVKKVLFEDNQRVKAGQLLVVLDDATYRAVLAQRQADLDAAMAQAGGAGVNVGLVSEQGSAQLMQAARERRAGEKQHCRREGRGPAQRRVREERIRDRKGNRGKRRRGRVSGQRRHSQ